jgi:hypothetical protein
VGNCWCDSTSYHPSAGRTKVGYQVFTQHEAAVMRLEVALFFLTKKFIKC